MSEPRASLVEDETNSNSNSNSNSSVRLEMWLGVLPQLLARIHVQTLNVRKIVHGLLVKLGKQHPQALMYPLSVLLKSPVAERKSAAESLMRR